MTIIENKVKLHNERMMEEVEDDISELTTERFNEGLKHVAKKHKEKYKFILARYRL